MTAPLSAAQRGVFFAQQLDPANPAYNVAEYVDIRGPLAVDVFRTAMSQVLDETDTLAVRVVVTDGLPGQVKGSPATLEIVDCESEDAALDWMRAALRTPMDGLLFHTALMSLDPERHFWVLRGHHLVIDGYGMSLLQRRVATVYSALLNGKVPSKSPFVSYVDVLAEEAAYESSDAYAADQQFWSARFAGFDAPTQVAAPVQDFLRESRSCPETPPARLVAAAALYFSRVRRCQEVVLGFPVIAPLGSAASKVPGMAVNILPLRIAVRSAETVSTLVHRVEQEVADALAHRRYRIEDVNRDLRLVGDRRVTGALIGVKPFDTRLRFGTSAAVVRYLTPGPIDDLSLTLYREPGGTGWMLDVDANPSLHSAEQLSVYADGIIHVLETFAGDPVVGQVSIVDERPSRDAATARDATLVELFEAVAARTPEAVAVTDAAQAFTYAQLNARANRLAHGLIDRGIGAGDLVGIALRPGFEVIAATVGVLKAGAAYLPLDTERNPAKRIEVILADAAPALIVDATTFAENDENPGRRVLPDEPAYVIYTSGSTGRPKGVTVTHRNVVRLFDATAEKFSFAGGDVWTMFHSYAFDFSVWEIWGALLHGGRLVIVDEHVSRTPADFFALLRAESVTVLNQTPSAFYQLAEADDGGPLALRYVIFGGEQLDPRRLADWTARRPDQPVLVNMFGITEITVHATHSLATELIGEAIDDLAVYLLDDALQPVPPGVTGEMYVSGPGLAQAYRGRPELTAERFVADPYGPPGARMYRSGDLARRTFAGQLEYLGRRDNQLQIRGYRVETGDIETALLKHATDAVVLPDGDRLIAYVVPASVDPLDLRRQLRAVLPDYMVPSVIVALDAFPLNQNGKLDQSALPAPTAAAISHAPRTPREEILCDLFAEVLRLPAVDTASDFFELGGHSLLGARLLTRIRGTLGVSLTIRDLFDAPTVAGLARRCEHAVDDRPALQAGNAATSYPLSFAQQRLWFVQRAGGAKPVYHIPFALRLSGELDVTALRQAVRDVVARHENLRVRMREDQQEVITVEPDLPVCATTADRLEHDLSGAARGGFDLAAGPPFRAELFELSRTDHVLLLTLHHLFGDEWSLEVLARDLAHAYKARMTEAVPVWPPLTVRYADYVDWQQKLLATVDDQLSHWVSTLDGLPDQLDLPTDRPRPAVASYRGRTVDLRIDAELRKRLRVLARQTGTSMFMVVHAALTAVLARLSASQDIPVGTPVAGRPDEALDDLVGMFVSTVVLRVDTAGAPRFRELLDRVRDVDLAAFDNADVPFEWVVEKLNPARSAARHPLFQVMLAYQSAWREPLSMPGLTTDRHPVQTGTSKFDLIFILDDSGEGVLEYSTDLFEEATASSLCARLVRVLRAAADNPDVSIADIDLLAPDERQRIVRDWNATTSPVPEPTFLDMFENAVRRAPDAPAMVHAGRSWTYAELNAASNRLARRLAEVGVEPERTVGIQLPRSADMIIGILACQKAGGAFVPLDPGWPEQRLMSVAADAGLVAVLSDSGIKLDATVVDPRAASGYPDGNLGVSIDPRNLSYVIYTSGSTGVPKGAMIRHQAISNRLPWQIDLLGFTPADAVLHKAPLTFDISVNEIFLPLSAGACLVVAEAGREGDVSHLLDLVTENSVTFVYLVSSMLDVMLELDDFPNRARSLRHVWCGGEVVTPELFRRFRSKIDATMYHGYGPAEATIGVTCQVYRGAAERGITIGRPNPNTRIHVLDQRLQPVPVGVPGELYIGGVPLARGYLNDPGKTSTKFVADPFAYEPGGRLYASGDIVRYRPDGAIEFLGRADNQVKIRGMRVELEEVEAVLAQHPGVRQAVVVARKTAAGVTRLSAYVVGTADASVRDWAATRLPEHMVPADCVTLPAFPLLSSGKVNRKALLANASPISTDRAYVPPRTDDEKLVVEVWQEVFGLDRVGADDHFFDLGGHSLLLAKVQALLRRRISRDIPVMDLFTHPTVREMALLLHGSQSDDTSALGILLPIRTEGDEPPIFCVHGATGLSWQYAGLRKYLPTNVPIYGIQARGFDRRRDLAGSLDEMTGEYLEHIRSVQPHGPYRLIGLSFGGVLVQQMAVRLQESGEDVSLLSILDSYPKYEWESFAVDYEQKALRSLLYMAGYDLSTLAGEPLRHERVTRIIRAQGGILAKLADFTLSAVVDNFINSAVLQQTATFRTFHGDVLFFRSVPDRALDDLRPEMWTPYVDGAIVSHDVDERHDDLLSADGLAQIGPTLASALR